MKNYRIGNSLTIKWTLTQTDGTAYILSAGNVELFASVPNHRFQVTDFTVSENVLTWRFDGHDQKYPGPYTLTLVENRDKIDMMTVDLCNAFGLVKWSCLAGGSDTLGVETEAIELTSTVSVSQIGLSPEIETLIDSVKEKIICLTRGIYFNEAGNLINYKNSKISELLLIPSKDVTIYNIWNDLGTGIVFLDEKGRYVSSIDTGGNTFKWEISNVSIPQEAKFFVIQTQADYVVVDSDEQLATGIAFPVMKDLSDQGEQIGTNVDNISILNNVISLNVTDAEASVNESGKYIEYPSGRIVSFSPMSITNPIQVSAGDVVLLSAACNATTAAICLCDSEGGNRKPVVEGNGEARRAVNFSYICDSDGYVMFSYSTSAGISVKVARSSVGKALTEIDDLQSSVEEISGDLGKKANLTTKLGKNLFDKEKIIDGYYIGTGNGILMSDADSSVSGLIPVLPDTVYYLRRPNGTGGASEARCVAADGQTMLKLLYLSGEERPNYFLNLSEAFKTPPEAAYFQFTCRFNGAECGYDQTQLELGEAFTGYEPYEEVRIVDYPELPSELSELEKRVSVLEGSGSIKRITIANSSKIGFFSNSFLNGYCMDGKHALDNLSMWSDYLLYNFGHSGDDALECLSRINDNETWLGDVPVQQWGLTYGVIAMQDNDGALYAADPDTYYENFKKLAEAIEAMGAIPILGTEHDSTMYYYALGRLANERGYMFMNWGREASKLFKSVFSPFWRNSHPATRTAWLWTYGMKRYLDALPRPLQGIKLFRIRPDTDTSDLQELIYTDNISRAERYMEIENGANALTDETNKFFDRLGNGDQYTNYKNEYQYLQQKTQAVGFGNYALIEFISPYDRNHLTSLNMLLKSTGVSKAYIKKNLSLTNALPSTHYIAFGVTEGEDLLTAGMQFQITGGVFSDTLLGTYTVEGIVNGMVVTTTLSTGKTTSGTDNPTTDIEGLVLAGSYSYPSASYLTRFRKPLGEWVEISLGNDGTTDLSDYTGYAMDYDKVSILLQGSDIVISDISFGVFGSMVKIQGIPSAPADWADGASIVNDTSVDDDTAWDNINAIPKYIPVTDPVSGQAEALPDGITTVRELSEGDSIRQVLNTEELNQSYRNSILQVRVMARYFPLYVDTDDKWAQSVVKPGSYDCSRMSVKIGGNKCAEIEVGAYWNIFLFNIPYFGGNDIVLECSKKSVQIAKVEIIKIK